MAEDHETGYGERSENDEERCSEVVEISTRHPQRLRELTDVFVESQQAEELDVHEEDDCAD